MFTINTTFFALLLVVLHKYVCRNKSLTGLMLPNIGPKNKVSMCMSLSMPMHVFLKDTVCFRYALSRNASKRLCVNKCITQYDVGSPHTTHLPCYARLLCGPTLRLRLLLCVYLIHLTSLCPYGFCTCHKFGSNYF